MAYFHFLSSIFCIIVFTHFNFTHVKKTLYCVIMFSFVVNCILNDYRQEKIFLLLSFLPFLVLFISLCSFEFPNLLSYFFIFVWNFFFIIVHCTSGLLAKYFLFWLIFHFPKTFLLDIFLSFQYFKNTATRSCGLYIFWQEVSCNFFIFLCFSMKYIFLLCLP